MKNSLQELVRRTGGRGIHVRDQKKSDGDGFDRNNVFAGSAVGSFEFADGTLSTFDLLARGFDLDGTADDDIIGGTNTIDRISGLNKSTTNQNFKSVLDGKAVNTGIYNALMRRSPIGGRCGAEGVEQLRWRYDADACNIIEVANDTDNAMQIERRIAA